MSCGVLPGRRAAVAKEALGRPIEATDIDEYNAERRVEADKKKGSLVAVATINMELRHLKAVLGIAHVWG